MNDVHFEIVLLGKTWTFRGIKAIGELIAFMDERASDSFDGTVMPQSLHGGEVGGNDRSTPLLPPPAEPQP